MKPLTLACLAIIVAACSSNGPSFLSMSEVELAAYNRGQLPGKQVYCVQEADSSSFIRKRSCQTYEDWMEHNEKSAMTVDLLNSRPDYNQPSPSENRHSRNF